MFLFISRGLNNKINCLYGSCLRIVYSDSRLSFDDLLHEDKRVSIHVKDLQALALEMFKVAKNFSSAIASASFEKRHNVYELQNPSGFT